MKNSSLNFTTVITEQRLMPGWVSILMAIISVVLFVGNCTGITLLLRFLCKSRTNERTPSQTFILAIAITTLIASIIGIPTAVTAASNGYKPVLLEVIAHFLQSHLLILCFSLNLHYLACITTERYLTITTRTTKMSTRASRKMIAGVTVYVLLLWSVIVADYVCDFAGNDPQSKCSLRRTPGYVSKTKIPVIVMIIWMSSCTIVLCTTTARTIVYIKNVLDDSERRFGVSSKRVETRRLTVVYILAVVFILIWLPYGIVTTQRGHMDWLLAKKLDITFETICYASFCTLPFAFYVMDKRFREYVNSLYKRRTITDHQPTLD